MGDFVTDEGRILVEQEQEDMKAGVARQFVYYRKLRGLTQDELAQRVGVSRTNITRFEKGSYNPSVEMMVKVAAALDLRVSITLEEGDADGR